MVRTVASGIRYVLRGGVYRAPVLVPARRTLRPGVSRSRSAERRTGPFSDRVWRPWISFRGFVVRRDVRPLPGDVPDASQCVACVARLSRYLQSKKIHAGAMAAPQVSAVLAAILISRRFDYGPFSSAADPVVRRLDRWSVLAGVEGRYASQCGGDDGDCRHLSQPPGRLCPRGAGSNHGPV